MVNVFLIPFNFSLKYKSIELDFDANIKLITKIKNKFFEYRQHQATTINTTTKI